MRKNIVPLLGIAFVVAVLCTGLFYGVFASRFGSVGALPPVRSMLVAAHDLPRGVPLKADDVKIAEVRSETTPRGTISRPEDVNGRSLVVSVSEGTPLAEAMLSSAASDREIPAGMRALTIRPADSSSVLAVLQAGRRIDIQAWSERGGEPELRTILENVEVLAATHAAEAASGNPGALPITVIVPAAKADTVALADSAAHLRIMLRGASDATSTGAARVAMNSIFAGREPRQATPAPAPEGSLPELNVSVLGVSDAALRRLDLPARGSAGLTVRGIENDGWERNLRQTIATHEAVQVDEQIIGASHGNVVRFGHGRWLVRIRFEAEDGRVRVYPEVITRAGDAVTVRRTRGDLAGSARAVAATLVSGVCASDEDRASLAEHVPAGVNARDLLIIVRPRATTLTASLPRNTQ